MNIVTILPYHDKIVFHIIKYILTVLPFDVKHDCAEPLGYAIHHKDTGTILFAADTYYVEYHFKNLSHILVECNYSINILNQNIQEALTFERVEIADKGSRIELSER